MRRSRDELAIDVEKMVQLRAENKTYRQIASIMGYRSASTVAELLQKRGHYSVVFNQLEINYLLTMLSNRPTIKLTESIIKKLSKRR